MNIDNVKTLELLRESSSKVNERNGKEITMPHPIEMFNIFQDIVGTDEIRVQVEGKLAINKDDNIETCYDKYLYLADLEDEVDFNGIYIHKRKVGLIVCNSSNQMKVFSGMEATACLNMSVFNAESLIEDKVSLELVKPYTNKVNNMGKQYIEEWCNKIERWINTRYTNENDWYRRKGEVLSNMSSTLFPYIKHAEQVMKDKNTIYYDMPDSDWKLLSAMTDKNKTVGLTNRINQIIELENLFL